MWRCPLCQSGLQLGNPWRCENNHSFDVSKRGYVNLLPVHKKGSKAPGDNKDMLAARQYFHQCGGYEPLMQKMAEILCLRFRDAKNTALSLYDAGCGEGTYLNVIYQALSKKGLDVQSAGSDISKDGIDFASRQYKASQFVVASSFDLPLSDDSVDVLLQVFAPGDDSEIQRVLNHHGYLLHVAPGPEHLMTIKQAAYRTPKPHTLPEETKPGFTLIQRENLRYTLSLSSTQQTQSLLTMTPFAWRLSEASQQQLTSTLKAVEIDFVISLWQVNSRI